nr:hypothetical protein [Paracoccaceae bacterium]
MRIGEVIEVSLGSRAAGRQSGAPEPAHGGFDLALADWLPAAEAPEPGATQQPSAPFVLSSLALPRVLANAPGVPAAPTVPAAMAEPLPAGFQVLPPEPGNSAGPHPVQESSGDATDRQHPEIATDSAVSVGVPPAFYPVTEVAPIAVPAGTLQTVLSADVPDAGHRGAAQGLALAEGAVPRDAAAGLAWPAAPGGDLRGTWPDGASLVVDPVAGDGLVSGAAMPDMPAPAPAAADAPLPSPASALHGRSAPEAPPSAGRRDGSGPVPAGTGLVQDL